MIFEIVKTQNALSKTTLWIARFDNILFLINSAVSFCCFLPFILLLLLLLLCFCYCELIILFVFVLFLSTLHACMHAHTCAQSVSRTNFEWFTLNSSSTTFKTRAQNANVLIIFLFTTKWFELNEYWRDSNLNLINHPKIGRWIEFCLLY